MTLKTSLNNRGPAFGLFRFTLRKNLVLLVLICIAALLFCPGLVLTDYNHYHDLAFVNMNNSIIPNFLAATAVLTTLLAVLMNIINFLYLFSRKSSDVFHSVPLTRCGLLFSRFFAGFTFALAPMVLCHLSLAGLTLLPGMTGDLRYIFMGLLFNILVALVCSAFSLIFIVCAGSAFDFLLSYGGVSVCGLLAIVVFHYTCDMMLTGYEYNAQSARPIFSLLSPYVFCGYGYMGFLRTGNDGLSPFTLENALFLLKAALLAALFLAVAALLYRRRPAERSGEAYAYRWVRVVSSLALCFIGGYGFGLIFSDDGPVSAAFWIFGLLGCLFVGVIFGAISDRGFKTIKRNLLPGLCSFVGLVLLIVTMWTGGFGYTARVPQAQRVKQVEIQFRGNRLIFDRPEEVLALHRAIIEDPEEALNLEPPYQYENPFVAIRFYYTLKNGTTLSRNFTVRLDSVAQELLDVYTSDTHIASLRQKLKTMPSLLTLTQRILTESDAKFDSEERGDTYAYEEGSLSATVTREEAERLITAYTNDLKKATALSLESSDYDYDYLLEWKVAGSSWEYDSIYLTVEQGFTETRAVLEEIDLPTRAAAEASQTEE